MAKALAKPIVWTDIKVKLGELVPWDHNPRQSTRKQAEGILQSFSEFGQVQTFAVGPKLDVYDGHQRLSALLTLHGKDYCIDARQSSRKLSEDERKRLVLMLHQGASGEWDWEQLSNFDPALLRSSGFDEAMLATLNRDQAALLELFAEAESGAAVDDVDVPVDRAEELREKWGVVSGQLWACGNHRILCGDSTKAEDVARVMGGEKADAVICDPPYGANFDPTKERGGPVGGKAAGGKIVKSIARPKVEGDETADTAKAAWATWQSLAPLHIWWGANYYADCLPPSSCWLVWDKENTGDFADVELAWCNQHRAARLFKHMWNGMLKDSERGERRLHGTQKPVALMAWCINQLGDGAQIIADPFSGSGPVLMACEELGRRAIAMEISPAYVAVTLERYFLATSKTPELVSEAIAA